MPPGERLRAPPVEWLGRVDYRSALAVQNARRDAVIAGRGAEVLLMVEHDPVITTGLRAVPDLPSRDALAAAGIDLVATGRGGLATYHGPGQLVGYLVVDARGRGLSVRAVVAAVEDGIVAWLSDLGLDAGRRVGFPGVWVGNDKICAIGLHFRRGVSMHGFALNVCTDLSAFGWITPCGITDGGVTSLEALGCAVPPVGHLAQVVGGYVVEAVVHR